MAYLGTLEPSLLSRNAVAVDRADLKPEPITVPDMEVFHAMVEVDDRAVVPLMPPSLAMTLPPMVAFVFWKCADSSVGPFALAQVRINTRFLVRSRGLLLGAYFDGPPEVAEKLRRHWGFPCTPGRIAIRSYHDERVGTVEANGRTILQIAGKDPNSINPGDIRDMANLNPVLLRGPEGDALRMLQVESEFRVVHATRSIRPVLEAFDDAAWNAPGVRQEYPVVAVHFASEFRLPAPRFLADPAGAPDQRSEAV